MMKWINKLSEQVVTLTGQRGTEAGEFIGIVAAFAIFFLVAWLAITAIAFVTGISTGALWTVAFIASIVYTAWPYIKR